VSATTGVEDRIEEVPFDEDIPETRPPRWGWTVVARKELADHLRFARNPDGSWDIGARWLILLLVLALAAAIPLYFASARIRDAAAAATGAPAVFLALFTLGSTDFPFLRVNAFVGIVAPLLGIAFGFDALNRERSERTLPRLLAQPIHRDDVINGKFAAGLAMIAIALVAMTMLVAGFGLFRLGIVPTSGEVLRIVVWVVITLLYVAFWLALGTLLSVIFRRAATAAVVGFGLWALVTIFGGLITSLVGGLIASSSAATTVDAALQAAQVQQLVDRLLPSTLYDEAALVALDPSVTRLSVPVTIGQLDQAQQQIPTLLTLDQSLLLAWPQLVALFGLTVLLFALAYIGFLRQEVRA
jgi:ABC-2 type transport system permease protein